MGRTIVIGDLHGCYEDAVALLDRPLVTEWAAGLDTGAVFGRGLTALVLPDWELVTQPGRDWSGGKKALPRYPVHGEVRVFS